MNSEAACEILVNGLLEDPNPIVRHECAYCLGELPFQKGILALMRSINSDPNRFVVHESLLALANTGYKFQQELISPFLESIDPDIRETAKISLQRSIQKNSPGFQISDPDSALLDLEQDEEVRIQSVFMLLEENSERAIDIMIEALHKETSPIVKHEIIFALGETASRRAADALERELLRDFNAFVIHETLLSLATLGYDSSLQVIRKYLSHEDDDIRLSAEIAMERIL